MNRFGIIAVFLVFVVPSFEAWQKKKAKFAWKGHKKVCKEYTSAPTLSPTIPPPCDVTEGAISQSTFESRLESYKATPTSTPAINTWNTQEVTHMKEAFQGFTTENPDVRCWNVAKVTTMARMFHGATKFDRDLSVWQADSCTTTTGMFASAIKFNSDVPRSTEISVFGKQIAVQRLRECLQV